MKQPKMILFDYGQTLINEGTFDGVKGTKAVLAHATKNKYNLTAEQVQREADAMNQELGRFNPEKRHLFQVEVSSDMFNRYLYESLGISIDLSSEERDRMFWDAAAPGRITDGIVEFLQYLKKRKIRTGVISNISYSSKVVEERIHRLIPDNEFEFILATSDYMFRKPNRRIFHLALEKADLLPEDVWYIGDQYECDIVGANNAGMQAIWYLGAIDMVYEKKEGIIEIRHWDELKNLLES